MQENQLLLDKVTVNIADPEEIPNANLLKENLISIHNPQPNARLIGWPWRVGFYNLGFKKNHHQRNGGVLKLLSKIGRPPVVFIRNTAENYDLSLTDTSIGDKNEQKTYDYIGVQSVQKKMELFLFNQGYFNAAVEADSVTNEKKKRITQKYLVQLNQVYNIESITQPSADTLAQLKISPALFDSSLLVVNTPFTTAKLENEQNRILQNLRNKGFYEIGNDNIHFDVDSTDHNHQVHIIVKIVSTPTAPDALKKFIINSVQVIEEQKNTSNMPYDTTSIGQIQFINKAEKFKPEKLHPFIYLKPEQTYQRKLHELTLSQLYELGVFRSVAPEFTKISPKTGTDNPLLDVKLNLLPSPQKSFTVDFEASNRYGSGSAIGQGFLGTALTFDYINKNVAGGAEKFNNQLYAGTELNLASEGNIISTFEISNSVSLTIPKYVELFKIKRLSPYFKPKTRVDFEINFLRRITYFNLLSGKLGFGYEFKTNDRTKWLLQPISITYLQLLSKTSLFDEVLAENPRLILLFEQTFIPGGYVSRQTTTQKNSHQRNYYNILMDLDLAGNSLYLIDKATKALTTNNNTLFDFGGLTYAQFVRLQADVRRYHTLSRNRNFVWRTYAGFAVPYGNSNFKNLPYVKQFFVGGGNDVRGFRIRSVGPGSYGQFEENVNEFNRTGNLKLEANLEYRFNIWESFYLKGAFFVDAGNVWVVSKLYDNRIGSQFRFNRFYKEIASSIGFGLRVDLSYFIIRLDMASPINNPNLPEGERWVFNKIQPLRFSWVRDNVIPNFGIGLPF